MTASPFDNPLLSGLLGDGEVSAYFATDADIAAMIAFEKALAAAEAAEGVIPAEAGPAIVAALAGYVPDIERLRAGTANDGVVVPEFVKQLRKAVGEVHGVHVHFGATSQDVIDTSLALRLREIVAVLEMRLEGVIALLNAMEERDGAIKVMAHTRMQAAIPVAAARKIASWREPLLRHLERLTQVKDDLLVLHFGGAAGTLDKLGDRSAADGG